MKPGLPLVVLSGVLVVLAMNAMFFVFLASTKECRNDKPIASPIVKMEPANKEALKE